MNNINSENLSVTPQSKVKRGRNRASYDRQQVYSIIDEAMVAYLGISLDDKPFVLPTSHWRDGDRIYWHGASSGRMARGVVGKPVCLTMALLDGLVLARSAFHHSVNYRSVMLFGEPEMVTDIDEKRRQLERFIDRIAPDRWADLRPMHDNELKATGIMSMVIDEGSAKVRDAPPAEDEEDYSWPVWAGVIPLQRQWREAQPCPRLEGEFDHPKLTETWKNWD
ncbi:MAG: pyridoxamine 5'-phosphate oxidase family protein [Motiliproteus sp.]|nr:pyridoxamine 5'-phosphate oxidase family protein [Motiliproteus sp.]MCW9054001.1 pyridoxamine 5'-phosphate oxidase family protein [Motiliproteus sp.]